MVRSRGALAAGFALLAWLLAATAGLSGSRLEVALAAATLVAVAALLPASRSGGAPAAACAVIGLGATFTAPSRIVGGALGDDGTTGLVAAGASGVLVAVAWALLRGRLGARRSRTPLVALVCVIGVVAVAGSSADERVGGCAYAGLTHGRTGIWAAALAPPASGRLRATASRASWSPAAHSSCASARSRSSTRTTCRSRRGWSSG